MSTDQIVNDYSYLAEGEAVGGQTCPECGGGRSRERSLRVSRYQGKLRAKCYRASCGWTYSSSGISNVTTVQQPKELQPFRVVNQRPLSEEEKGMLSSKFQIEAGMFDWARWYKVDDVFNGFGPRFVLPILGPDGSVRGKTFRSWQGHLPKSMINKLSNEHMMCWYKPQPYGKVLVIVEDQPSALRLAGAKIDALALCGTLINDARMSEIRQQGYDKVWLCLDDDATTLAFNEVARYKMRFKQLLIKPLKVDVKNMTPAQFEEFVTSVK